MTPITQHFSLEELTRSELASRRGLNNTPGPAEQANLERLAETLLEPARWLLGVPLRINSGYRSDIVNAIVGGARNSAHMDGRAADLVPAGLDLRAAFDQLRASGLPFDQIILECNAWIHLAVARDGEAPRRQALLASGGPGAWHYTEVAHG